jgi:hypothetical protein
MDAISMHTEKKLKSRKLFDFRVYGMSAVSLPRPNNSRAQSEPLNSRSKIGSNTSDKLKFSVVQGE